MPFNSRDLWLVLKAQDQTNRALNTFARNVRNAGDTVAMAQLQAQRAAALGAISQARLANEVQRAAVTTDTARKATIMQTMALKNNEIQTIRAEIAQMQAQKAAIQSTAATWKNNGATEASVDALKKQASAIGDNITRRKLLISQIQMEVAAIQQNVNAVQGGINARRTQMAGNDRFIAQQKQVLAGIDDEIDRLDAANKSAEDYERRLARLSGALQQASQTATAMGFALTAAGAVAAIGIKQAIDTAVAYERQVRLTATQVDGFTGNLNELADIGRNLARNIAVPFEQIQPALFDIFSSMEVNTKDAEALLTQFSKAAVAGQVEIQDVSRATIGLLNAFQRPASDVNKLLDIQFQLVQEGVGTYEEWNQRIGLVTPSAVRAGQSIEVMMAALAASTRMGMSAARSGTAVARSFDALSNPKTVKNLKELGVSVQDAQGKFRPFNEVLRDFRAVLLKMPEKDRLATILDVFKGAGGTIEARRFLQNVLLGAGNLEMFDNILKETSNSAGSMEKAYGLMSEGVAAQTQLLKNQWELLKESVGKALMPIFAQVVGWLAKVLQKFNDLSPQTKKVVAIFVGLAAVFALVMGPLLLIVGGIAAVVAAFVVAGTAIAVVIGGLTLLILAITGVGIAFGIIMAVSGNFRTVMSNVYDDVKALWTIISDFASSVKESFETNIMPPLQNLRSYIEDWVLPAFRNFRDEVGDRVLSALKDMADVIENNLKPTMKAIGEEIEQRIQPAVKKLTDLWIEHRDQIMEVINFLIILIKFFGIIGGIIALVAGSQVVLFLINSFMALIAIIGLVISALGNSVEFWHATVNAIKSAAQTAKDWNAAVQKAIDDVLRSLIELVRGVQGMVKQFFNAGSSIIQNLIDGMQSKIDSLFSMASKVAGIVSGFLPGSPVKMGPLRVLNNGYAGGQIVKMLVSGMDRQLGYLGTSANDLGLGAFNRIGLSSDSSGTGGIVKNYYITQNITTQEISPVRQAADLGWEVTTVM